MGGIFIIHIITTSRINVFQKELFTMIRLKKYVADEISVVTKVQVIRHTLLNVTVFILNAYVPVVIIINIIQLFVMIEMFAGIHTSSKIKMGFKFKSK